MNARPWRAPDIRVRAASREDEEPARTLALRLALPFDASPPAPPPRTPVGRRRDARREPSDGAASWTLRVDGDRRALERPDGVRLEIDFTAGRTAARQREAGLVRQPLARALGVPRLRRRLGRSPTVVEATGGLGRDAWFAASLGCPVTVIERSPVVHALLEAALARARAAPASADVAARVTLVHGEAGDVLGRLDPGLADVVYLDPMYPAMRRRAAVSKGMQFLHELLGPPDTHASPLDAALAVATRQVTVKRPSSAPPLAGGAVFGWQRVSVESPGTRYDLYLSPEATAT